MGQQSSSVVECLLTTQGRGFYSQQQNLKTNKNPLQLLTFNVTVWAPWLSASYSFRSFSSVPSTHIVGSQMPLTPAPIGLTLSSVFGKHLAPLVHTLYKVTYIGKQKSNINHEVGQVRRWGESRRSWRREMIEICL